jgi:hypothetical protein
MIFKYTTFTVRKIHVSCMTFDSICPIIYECSRNVVYVTNIDTSKIVLALSSAWNWKETEKFRFFCLASISVGNVISELRKIELLPQNHRPFDFYTNTISLENIGFGLRHTF